MTRSVAHLFKYPRGARRGQCKSADITANGVCYRPAWGAAISRPGERDRAQAQAQSEGTPVAGGDAARRPRRADYGDITAGEPRAAPR
jgi:hypothetical protein